jgi:hypothetical protein
MRLPGLLAAALSAAAAAQTSANLFDIYSGCTNFTSRGVVATNAGEYLLQVRASHFVGVGHDPTGNGTLLSGFQYFTQDQNAATVETYSLVVRSDAAGAPDCSAAGLLLSVGPLSTPGGTGTIAWQITTNLTTVSTALPQCSTYYQGLEFAAAPGWPNEGQSVHLTDYPLGDNPAPGALSLTWNCLNGAPQQPQFRESIRVGSLVRAPVLHMGNVDPSLATTCLVSVGNRSFGAGGMWPQCQGTAGPRNDGLDCRVRDAASANGVFALFLGTDLGCPGVPLSGIADGALYLNPGGAFLQVTAGVLDSGGLGTATAVPPGSAACTTVVNRFLHFQAFTVGGGFTLPGRLSNRASVNYLP